MPRTLTKDLILDTPLVEFSSLITKDGPNEIIHRRIEVIKEKGERTELRQEFIKNFVDKLSLTLGIRLKEAPALLNDLSDLEIENIIKRVDRRSKKLAIIERIFWTSLWLFAVGSLCKFFGEALFFMMVFASAISLGAPIYGPLIPIFGGADRDFFFSTNIGYITDRAKLIRLYGSNYFPHNELRRKFTLRDPEVDKN